MKHHRPASTLRARPALHFQPHAAQPSACLLPAGAPTHRKSATPAQSAHPNNARSQYAPDGQCHSGDGWQRARANGYACAWLSVYSPSGASPRRRVYARADHASAVLQLGQHGPRYEFRESVPRRPERNQRTSRATRSCRVFRVDRAHLREGPARLRCLGLRTPSTSQHAGRGVVRWLQERARGVAARWRSFTVSNAGVPSRAEATWLRSLRCVGPPDSDQCTSLLLPFCFVVCGTLSIRPLLYHTSD
jgi:hypothetical protein